MYRIVVDQSTSASKALLFSGNKIVSRIDKKHEQIYPFENYVEHNPHEIISNVEFVIEEVIRKNGLKYTDIKSLSITNQRETSVAWKKSSGRPIYNAIVWQCSRTTTYCNEISIHNPQINEVTGLRANNYFSGPKYNWIINNVEEAKPLASSGDLAFGTIESWLIYNLSSERNHFSDITNASRTLLMDINTNKWDRVLLDLFEIPQSAMPEIKLPTDNFGTYKGIPITGVIADSQAALVAQELKPFVEAKVTMGTGSSIMVNVDKDSTFRNIKVLTALYGYEEQNLYAIEGIIKSFGDTLEFVKESLGTFEDYDDIFKYTFENYDENNIIYIPGQYGLGCPYWKDDIGCQILGLSRKSTSKDIAAAAIESLGYQIKAVIDEIEKTTNVTIEQLKVDGGISKQSGFIRFLADLTQKEVYVLAIEEASAYGAYKTIAKDENNITVGKLYEPQAEDDRAVMKYQAWKQAIELFISSDKKTF